MRKLLVIAPQNPYPAKDGGKIGIYYPVIHLAKNFEVHFAFITPTAVSKDVYDHFKQHKVVIYPQVKNTKDSLAGYLVNLKSKLPYKFEKYCSPDILSSLINICLDEQIGFVWCNHAHVAWYGLQLKEKTGVKIFLREHNIEYSLVEQVMQLQTNPLKKAFVKYQFLKTKRFERYCWERFQKVFFISDSDVSVVKDQNDKWKFVLLYDSFEVAKVVAKFSKEPYSFIFTANLEVFQNNYNLKQFIKLIWHPLIAKDSRWKLYVTGNKPGIIEQQLDIDLPTNNILSLGFVDDIHATIASKKYFISPTYIGSGIRIKVLNALSGGAVCFVTDLDLKMLKTLEDGYNLIKYDDFEDFYYKLLLLENDDALYNVISLHAKEVGASFSWTNYAETVYNEVVTTEGVTSR